MAQLKAIIDKLLTNASQAYIPTGFISEQILPEISVVQKTGKLGTYGTDHLRIEAAVTGGRGKYRRVETMTRSTSSYSVDSYGLEGMVTEDDYANVEAPFDAEADETMGLTTLLWVRKEKSLADVLTSTSIITQTTTLSGTSQFSDYLNSDPLAKFSTARTTIKSGCGLPPNTAIMSWEVWQQLRYHPQILDSLGFKQNRPGGLALPELASALEVERVLIGMAMYESADEGQTSSLANIWGKHIVLAVCPPSAQKYQVSLGYRVQLSGRPARRVYKSSNTNPPNSTLITCDDSYDMMISKAAAAYLIYNAVA